MFSFYDEFIKLETCTFYGLLHCGRKSSAMKKSFMGTPEVQLARGLGLFGWLLV